MRKAIHKLYREDGYEHADETEVVACDPLDRFVDPKVARDWETVTCKRCLDTLAKKLERKADALSEIKEGSVWAKEVLVDEARAQVEALMKGKQ